MKKKVLMIISLVAVVLGTVSLSACGGDKYCAVANCPAEHSRYSNYCFEHKCMNKSCNNRSTGRYQYCVKCLNKGE